MKIAFHSSQLCLRGTEIALYDYAYYNREILKNDSIIIAYSKGNMDAYDKFKKEFDVYLYDDFSEVVNIVTDYNIDAVYSIKAGFNDNKLVPNAKNLVHVVFQYKEPHGDKYAYVSKWLSNVMSNGTIPYVPHIVDILKYDHYQNMRSDLNIPPDAKVFGYYGGSDSFNIQFVKDTVINVVRENQKIYFIFMNVDKFCDLPNVIFLPGTFDMYKKVSFINTCDACLHARIKGESFGLTIAEFSIKNKPILVYEHSIDSAHFDMLGDKCIKYNNLNIKNILLNLDNVIGLKTDWNAYQNYTPENVMQQFKNVFLS